MLTALALPALVLPASLALVEPPGWSPPAASTGAPTGVPDAASTGVPGAVVSWWSWWMACGGTCCTPTSHSNSSAPRSICSILGVPTPADRSDAGGECAGDGARSPGEGAAPQPVGVCDAGAAWRRGEAFSSGGQPERSDGEDHALL